MSSSNASARAGLCIAAKVGGDVCGSGQAQCADSQAAAGGHGAGGAAGAQLGGVFGEGHIAHAVQGFDLPVSPNEGGELGGAAWSAVRLVTA